MIKGSWDIAIQQKRYARLYLGLNLEFQEGAVPSSLHSIPIPFMKRDHGLLRYKKINFPETYGGYKIRCDQEIERLERLKLTDNENVRIIIDMHLKILKYISEGPYDSNR